MASQNNWFIDLGLAPSAAVILDEGGKIVFTNQSWDDFARQNNYRGGGFIGVDYIAICNSVIGVERAQSLATAVGLREILQGAREMFEITYPCHAPTEKRWFKCVAFRHGKHVVVLHINISQEQEMDQNALGCTPGVLKSSQLFHDLRSPLTTIIGYAQACQTYPDDKLVQVREGHALIEMAGARVLDIVNDVMALFQEAQDNVPLKEQPVPLAKLVDEILIALRPSADDNNVQLSHNIHQDLVLLGDESKLYRLFTNLCANAVKYNVAGGRVWVEATLNASVGIVVKVCDTGLGIPKDQQEGVFSPFERVMQDENWQGREGVGLGLAIVKELAERHDAEIHLVSEVGVGSTFTTAFPAWRTVRKARKPEA